MPKRLFVANFPFSTTDDDLRELFSHSGTVTDAKVITDRDTGKSRGFGFVTMDTDAEGQRATGDLNGHEYGGRRLQVNEAREQERGGARGHDRGGRPERRAPRW